MKAAPFHYARAASLHAALDALAAGPEALVISGGQSLAPLLNLRMTLCDTIVDIGGLTELQACWQTDHVTLIGAGVTHAMIEDGLTPDPAHGMLRRAAGKIAYRAVRCQGTIGGSLAMADPAADWPCILLALGATAILRSALGERRVALDDLLVGVYETSLRPGEIIQALEIPNLPPQARAASAKISRKTGAFANSMVAVVLNGESSRAVLGAAGPRATILPHVSAALASGSPLDQITGLVTRDVADILPEPDPYLQSLHETNVRRALLEVFAP